MAAGRTRDVRHDHRAVEKQVRGGEPCRRVAPVGDSPTQPPFCFPPVILAGYVDPRRVPPKLELEIHFEPHRIAGLPFPLDPQILAAFHATHYLAIHADAGLVTPVGYAQRQCERLGLGRGNRQIDNRVPRVVGVLFDGRDVFIVPGP